MNFFRRPPPTTAAEPRAGPPTSAARLEKERKWMSTLSSRDHANDAVLGSSVNEPSTGDVKERGRATVGQSMPSEATRKGGRTFGRWLNTSGTEEHSRESSRASIRSKRSFFNTANIQNPNPSRHSRPESSASSSACPSTTSDPTLSPVLFNNFAASAESEMSRSSTTTETKNLASRLQELAVANADGLLDDDEYRLLRQQVFETHSQRNHSNDTIETSVVKLSEGKITVPRLHGITGEAGAFAIPASAPTTPPTSYTETLASPAPSPLRAPSVSSRQSRRRSVLAPIGSFFGRDALQSAPPDENLDIVTPPLSFRADHYRPISPVPLPSDSISVTSGRSYRPTLSPPMSPARNRSIRNHSGLASSALDSRPSSYFAGSSISSNGRGYGGGGGGGGGESVFSGGSRSHGHPPRSPTSSRTRSYYPGAPSSSLSHGYSSNRSHDRGSGVETLLSHSLPPITSSTDPILFAATSREPTAQELSKEIREIEEECERMRQNWRDMACRRIEAWGAQVGESTVRAAKAKARQDAVQKQLEQRGPGATRGAAATTGSKKGLFKRASFLPALHSSSSSAMATMNVPNHLAPIDTLVEDLLPEFLISSKTPLPPDFESKLSPQLVESTLTFRVAMEELRERQRRSGEKYERRLEFLRAKEAGARIKEGLLK